MNIDKNTLKVIQGVVCDIGATSVDVSKAVSGCGQLWDGALFAIVNVNGAKIITLHNSADEEVGDVVAAKGNCGIGLDGRFFHVEDGKVAFNSSGS